jgi:drug/metabolite transporter (DMT)-like permease
MTSSSFSPQKPSGVETDITQTTSPTPLNATTTTKPSGRLQAKTYLALLIITIASPLGNVLLASGMKRVGKVTFQAPAQVLHTFLQVFASPQIWLGIASLIAFFVMYMLLLSWADYSFVQPASSMAYGVTALLGYFVLGERVSLLRWAGIGIICLGVFIVGRTNPQTTTRS